MIRFKTGHWYIITCWNNASIKVEYLSDSNCQVALPTVLPGPRNSPSEWALPKICFINTCACSLCHSLPLMPSDFLWRLDNVASLEGNYLEDFVFWVWGLLFPVLFWYSPPLSLLTSSLPAFVCCLACLIAWPARMVFTCPSLSPSFHCVFSLRAPFSLCQFVIVLPSLYQTYKKRHFTKATILKMFIFVSK